MTNFLWKKAIGAIIIWLIGSIFFLFFLIWKIKYYSLTLGWTYGVFISIISFILTSFWSRHLLQKPRGKLIAFLLTFLKFNIIMIFQLGLIFLLIILDHVFHGNNLFVDPKIDNLYDPINLFTSLAGIAVVMLSIFITNYLELKHI